MYISSFHFLIISPSVLHLVLWSKKNVVNQTKLNLGAKDILKEEKNTVELLKIHLMIYKIIERQSFFIFGLHIYPN